MAVVLYGSSNGPSLQQDEYGNNYWSDGQNLQRSGNYADDPYGGVPININTGMSAANMQSLTGTLSSGFSDLYKLIQENTDKNNAWSAAQAQKQMDFQERMNSIAMDFNSLEAAKNRDWQEMMSNTAHQREIRDLQAAGLNPVLSASGGNGAAVGSGATAQGVTSSGAMADADHSGNAAISSLYGALLSAQTQMYNANLSAKTNLEIADKQMRASMYGAQLAAETARSNNPWQILTGLSDHLFGNENQRGSGAKSFLDDALSGAKVLYDYGKALFKSNPNSHSGSSRNSSKIFSGKF